MAAKVYDAREVGCTIGGYEIDDFVEFKHKNDPDASHIESIKGVAGYNIKPPKPSWQITVKETSKTLTDVIAMREGRTLVEVVYTSPTRTVTCLESLVIGVEPQSGSNEAGNVTISGLSMRIEESYETVV